MSELYNQAEESRYLEDQRILPSSFTTRRAVGNIAATTMSEDYASAPPERPAAYYENIRRTDDNVRQEMMDIGQTRLD